MHQKHSGQNLTTLQRKEASIKMAIRRSVSFTEESLKVIQRWRVEHSTETQIPDFSQAINVLITNNKTG
jgi:hypothetical protein